MFCWRRYLEECRKANSPVALLTTIVMFCVMEINVGQKLFVFCAHIHTNTHAFFPHFQFPKVRQCHQIPSQNLYWNRTAHSFKVAWEPPATVIHQLSKTQADRKNKGSETDTTHTHQKRWDSGNVSLKSSWAVTDAQVTSALIYSRASIHKWATIHTKDKAEGAVEGVTPHNVVGIVSMWPGSFSCTKSSSNIMLAIDVTACSQVAG